ncbi:AUGMIN subunit 1 [Camellia lanceoleosa]|uniref:AUGMIN subunit 1 n=1 Tax=Camellia lanceoleosa TaxID=1840588 RepID=A0ACC0IWC4_9ERIC|nr:AUGMIN subunit 1 [Camellia lanceoleosa]
MTSFNPSTSEVDTFTNPCGLNTEVTLVAVPETVEPNPTFSVNQEEEISNKGAGRKKKGRIRKASRSATSNPLAVINNNNNTLVGSKRGNNQNKEQDSVDPISFENIGIVGDWVMEKEGCSEDFGSIDWMTVDPPLGNAMLLGPSTDDVEDLGTGFDDDEIFEGVKDGEEKKWWLGAGGSVLVASRLHVSEAYPGLPSILWKDFAVCLQFGIRFPRKRWIGVCSMSWSNLLKLSFLVASGDISLKKNRVEEKRNQLQRESKILLDYTRKAITRLTYLKITLQQLEDEEFSPSEVAATVTIFCKRNSNSRQVHQFLLQFINFYNERVSDYAPLPFA